MHAFTAKVIKESNNRFAAYKAGNSEENNRIEAMLVALDTFRIHKELELEAIFVTINIAYAMQKLTA